MNPRWRMLLWEQGRTAGVLCLAFCGLSVAHVLIVQAFYRSGQMATVDVSTFLNHYLHFIPMFFAVALTVRQGGSGHLVWNFEPRLLRLPISLPVAFTVIVAVRILCMVTLLMLNVLLAHTFPQNLFELQWTALILPLYVYLLLQAFVWSYRRAPILTAFLLLAALMETVAYRFSYGIEEYPVPILVHLITHPNLILIIPSLSLAMMALGVYLERRDEHFGPPRLGELLELANNNRSSLSVDTAKSAFEAQLWYEYRRVGRLLLVFLVVITGLITLFPIFVSGEPQLFFDIGLAQYIPLIAFPFAALISGAIGRFPRSRYASLRPAASHELAAAQCLAQLRSLLCTAPLVFLLFLAYMLLGSIERGVIVTSWQKGYTDALDLIVYCMRPLTLSFLVAWLMLWITTGLMALMAGATIVCMLAALIRVQLSSTEYQNQFEDSFYITVCILLVLTVYTLYSSYRNKAVPLGKILLQVISCLMITGFIYFSNSEIAGIHGVMFAFTCGTACVLPLTALTWTIGYQRHRDSSTISLRSLFSFPVFISAFRKRDKNAASTLGTK